MMEDSSTEGGSCTPEGLVRHADALVRIHCGGLQNADRRDLVQDVMCAYAKGVARRDPPETPRAWISEVVRKLHALRCRNRDRRRCIAWLDLSRDSEAEEGATGRATEPAARTDGEAGFEQLLADIGPFLSEQEVADARSMAEGRTCAEVARVTNVSPDAVERRWKKTKKKLRRLLG